MPANIAGVIAVVRKLTPPPGGANAPTSIEGIRNDSRQLMKIAEHFDALEHLA